MQDATRPTGETIFAMRSKSKKPDTLVTHAGRAPEANHGVVNPPVYHASTIIHPTVAALEAAQRNRYGQVTYGRIGTPTTFAFEEAVTALEGGHRAVAFRSGAAACFAALLAFVKAGDHVLMTDSVYGPVRGFCNGFLQRFGVATTFYDPLIGADIAGADPRRTRASSISRAPARSPSRCRTCRRSSPPPRRAASPRSSTIPGRRRCS